MSGAPAAPASGALDATVERVLGELVRDLQGAFGPALQSVLLFGSAAEGRLRPTSDVNLLVVLGAFEATAADRAREPLRLAKAALDLHVMLVLHDELALAEQAFALRFADIASRHRVLHGSDPFAGFELPREALVRRLGQVLLNLQIRTRERYLLLSLREEQLARHLADLAGPLRAAAASLLQLQGRAAASPKQALERLAAEIGPEGIEQALAAMSEAREQRLLGPGRAPAAAWQLMALIEAMRRAQAALA